MKNENYVYFNRDSAVLLERTKVGKMRAIETWKVSIADSNEYEYYSFVSDEVRAIKGEGKYFIIESGKFENDFVAISSHEAWVKALEKVTEEEEDLEKERKERKIKQVIDFSIPNLRHK